MCIERCLHGSGESGSTGGRLSHSLDVEVAKLKMLKANFAAQKYRMEDNITVHYPEKIAALESKAEGYRADIQTYMQNRPADREQFSMKVGNTAYHSRKEAGAALVEMCRNISGIYQQAAIEEYQGFKMSASSIWKGVCAMIQKQALTLLASSSGWIMYWKLCRKNWISCSRIWIMCSASLKRQRKKWLSHLKKNRRF